MDIWGIPLTLVTFLCIFLGGSWHAMPPISLGKGSMCQRPTLCMTPHICPHVTLPIRAPLFLDVRKLNMVLSKSACITFALQIASSKEHFYTSSLPLTFPRATIPASKRLLWGPSSSTPHRGCTPLSRIPL